MAVTCWSHRRQKACRNRGRSGSMCWASGSCAEAIRPQAQMSGEGEEEPLELSAVGLGSAVAVERALLEASCDDLETGPVEGTGRRRQLRDHVRAVAPLLDHLDHAANLALGPLQPSDHAGHRLAVCFHAGSLKVGSGRVTS